MSFDIPTGTRGVRRRRPAGVVSRLVRSVMMWRHRQHWSFMGMDVLFLTTVGRKSGATRITPVAWFAGEHGTWLIVASAAGSARNPSWYHNVAARPDQITIELSDRTVAVHARQLTGARRDEAWQQIIAAQPRYAHYQAKTDRPLPIIQLTPTPGPGASATNAGADP